MKNYFTVFDIARLFFSGIKQTNCLTKCNVGSIADDFYKFFKLENGSSLPVNLICTNRVMQFWHQGKVLSSPSSPIAKISDLQPFKTGNFKKSNCLVLKEIF